MTPPVQDRLSTTQSSLQAQAQQDYRTTQPQRPTNPVGGIYLQRPKERQKKEIIKIGTADVAIKEDNEGLMFFGESANTIKKKIRLPSK
jgi:hypothetical protein